MDIIEPVAEIIGSSEPIRKMASIQRILKLEPIEFLNKDGQLETASAIERATVLGWKCVCKKGEFRVGDLGVFFEVGSIIPFANWNNFLRDKNRPEKRIRLKTCRFLKTLSQGLMMPLTILKEYGELVYNDDQIIGLYTNGKNIQNNEPSQQ